MSNKTVPLSQTPDFIQAGAKHFDAEFKELGISPIHLTRHVYGWGYIRYATALNAQELKLYLNEGWVIIDLEY